MSQKSIFERLGEIKTENKKVESLKDEINDVLSKMEQMEKENNELYFKISVMQDDMIAIKSKFGRDIDDLRNRNISPTTQSQNIDFSELENKFAPKEETAKEIEDLKVVIESYVKNQPSILINKTYETRIKALEDKKIVLKTFK